VVVAAFLSEAARSFFASAIAGGEQRT